MGNFRYQRFEHRGTPVYIDPEFPDWFAPSQQADLLFSPLSSGKSRREALHEYMKAAGISQTAAWTQGCELLSRFSNRVRREHKGRASYRKKASLKECWLHITNRCNMCCSHCMFSSGNNKDQPSLSEDMLIKAVDQAMEKGCRIFYFTGGEPFIYPSFTDICDHILENSNAHIVILTNLKNITSFDSWLDRIPKERTHFQVSMDGLEEGHDRLRGKGAFASLLKNLRYLRSKDLPVTISMSVIKANAGDMPAIVDIASDLGISNIHYMWFFKKGKGDAGLFIPPEEIFPLLVRSYNKATSRGIQIDNFETLRSQVFSIPGTRFDLSNIAWESAAIGPDGRVYPSAALIGEQDLCAGDLNERSLSEIWEKSPVLEQVRAASLLDDAVTREDPFRFFTGGGDIDHSYIAGGRFTGCDPYLPLYRSCTLHLITEEAEKFREPVSSGLLCRMGEHLQECDEENSSVGLTHSNCVLSLPGKDGYQSVRYFYSRAAEDVDEEILNPISYDQADISYIPEKARQRSYGCGSPVLDAHPAPGETLVDLGSGTGIECFIAAKEVGPSGKVHGIDMSDTMLSVATDSLKDVSGNLGYANVTFHKGYLEQIPLDEDTVNVVTSNCVINLSPDKRSTFREIRRVLVPGGRLCISDIVTDNDIPVEIKYNEKLRGECLGGAMRQNELFGMLTDLGFTNIRVLKRFLYRTVKGHDFFSVTYSAEKPSSETLHKDIIYRGPFRSVITESGQILQRGQKTTVPVPDLSLLDSSSFFVLDENGNPENIEQDLSCCSFKAPQETTEPEISGHTGRTGKHQTGCMVCGSRLEYFHSHRTEVCHYCAQEIRATSMCINGHFVCDSCHSKDALEIIRNISLQASHSDMIDLLKVMRSHSSIPLHGPEHHSMVPGVILSVYKNRGGDISNGEILEGIERGGTVAGGACAFLGVCGAAAGAGIAFSIMLRSDPYKGEQRQLVQKITMEVLSKIASYKAPRCCQRDCWLALKKASQLSEKYLGLHLPAEGSLKCGQAHLNKECIEEKCPIYDRSTVKRPI